MSHLQPAPTAASERSVSATVPRKWGLNAQASFRAEAIDRNRFVAWYARIAAALLGSAAFFIYDATIILADRTQDDTSVAVLEAGNRILHGRENLETGQCGYLLTADDSYLQPYRSAVRDLDNAVLQRHQLVALDTQSTALVGRIERAKNDKVFYLDINGIKAVKDTLGHTAPQLTRSVCLNSGPASVGMLDVPDKARVATSR
ncbi:MULTISPECIES: CHASE3 domain-containing protein [Paraburkholderia]|uniref:CHASE3 domain-containing protein n=1 Tax=Paraburkholderia TaxID=1822464 RepID=UPI000A05507D|nr:MULTISPECIES: CHASE3 domain-containing protein [Paraburkholderia]MDH6146585.1 hypothetical protein [Paraburkholderia sp. WSM4179]